MSDKYRVKFWSVDNPDEYAFVRGDDGNATEFTETEAQAFAERQSDTWAGVFAFQVVPPDWTPPRIIAKEIPETRAGSPGCVDGDDLLGVKPPC